MGICGKSPKYNISDGYAAGEVMTESIAEFLSSVAGGNPYLTLFLISIVPVVELRGAIVLMGGMQGINELAGMLCCVAGSTLAVLPVILLIRPLIRKLKASRAFRRVGKSMETHLNERASSVHTESKHKEGKISSETKKFWGLYAFVAVPLPMTGAWTGAAIGGILEMTVWKAALAVFMGNVTAAGILTLLVKLVPDGFMDFFLYGFIILAVAVFCSVYVAGSLKRRKTGKAETEEEGS